MKTFWVLEYIDKKKKSGNSNLKALFFAVERSHKKKLCNKRSLVLHLYMERECMQVTPEVVSSSQREADMIWSSFIEEMLVESRTSSMHKV